MGLSSWCLLQSLSDLPRATRDEEQTIATPRMPWHQVWAAMGPSGGAWAPALKGCSFPSPSSAAGKFM